MIIYKYIHFVIKIVKKYISINKLYIMEDNNNHYDEELINQIKSNLNDIDFLKTKLEEDGMLLQFIKNQTE